MQNYKNRVSGYPVCQVTRIIHGPAEHFHVVHTIRNVWLFTHIIVTPRAFSSDSNLERQELTLLARLVLHSPTQQEETEARNVKLLALGHFISK